MLVRERLRTAFPGNYFTKAVLTPATRHARGNRCCGPATMFLMKPGVQQGVTYTISCAGTPSIKTVMATSVSSLPRNVSRQWNPLRRTRGHGSNATLSATTSPSWHVLRATRGSLKGRGAARPAGKTRALGPGVMPAGKADVQQTPAAPVSGRRCFLATLWMIGPMCSEAQAQPDVQGLILSGQRKFTEVRPQGWHKPPLPLLSRRQPARGLSLTSQSYELSPESVPVQGAVEESVLDFDDAIRLDKRIKIYLWQRGLSLYYAGRYADGAVQFREDATVNPNDTEEAVWAFLCEAQENGFDLAQNNLMQVGRDSRRVMRTVYQVFAGSTSVDELSSLASAGHGGSDSFYSLLYAGLYFEAQGDAATSEQYIKGSLETAYAKQSADYMTKLARVHAKRRGFAAEEAVEQM